MQCIIKYRTHSAIKIFSCRSFSDISRPHTFNYVAFSLNCMSMLKLFSKIIALEQIMTQNTQHFEIAWYLKVCWLYKLVRLALKVIFFPCKQDFTGVSNFHFVADCRRSLYLFTGVHHNINWRDVQRKNVVNNIDMSGWRTSWQNGPYKTNTQNNTKARRTPRRNRHSEINVCVFFRIFLFLLFCIHKFSNDSS